MGSNQYVPTTQFSHNSFTLTFLSFCSYYYSLHMRITALLAFQEKMQLYHFRPICIKPFACVFIILKTTITNTQSTDPNITITICYTLVAKNKELTLTCESRSPVRWDLFHFGTNFNIRSGYLQQFPAKQKVVISFFTYNDLPKDIIGFCYSDISCP